MEGFMRDYAPNDLVSVIDKRPLLYPLLTSFVHGLSGYRSENAFSVNFICGVFILFFMYLLVNRLIDNKWGIAAAFIIASTPNFGIWITSGGFEAANLLFLILVLLTAHTFFVRREIEDAEIWLMTLILFFQCRYESVAAGIAFLLWLPFWINKRLVREASIVTLISPLLILPVLWQRKIFLHSTEPVKAAIDLMETVGRPFSFDYFLANTPKNLFVFMGLDPNAGFTLPVFCLAVFGLYFIFKDGIIRKEPAVAENKLFYGFAGTVLLLPGVVIFAYFWGDLAQAASNRFAVVFIPFLCFPACYALSTFHPRKTAVSKNILYCSGLFYFLFHLSFIQHPPMISRLSLQYEYNKSISVLESHSSKNSETILIICEQPNLFIVRGYGAITFYSANQRWEETSSTIKDYFDRAIVLQRCDPETGRPLKNNWLSRRYPLAPPFASVKVKPEMILKISEIKLANYGS